MSEQPQANDTKQFHGWRLIAIIMVVISVLAAISAIVDLAVLR
jgi:hypothetical protein